ncbi:hypothetical protein B9G55_10950 [Saccharibacillus sp. O16]|nr:hypothetical protein B9G55_10950 [Saccharibacillus sp. O16]
MNSLYVVQLEARLGRLVAILEQEQPAGGRASRQIEIPLRLASPQQRILWQQLAGRSAMGLHRLLEEAGDLTVRLGSGTKRSRKASAEAAEKDAGADGSDSPPAPREELRAADGTAASAAAVRTVLPFAGGDAAWELAAAEEVGGPEVQAALTAAAAAARTRLAFGLTLAGVDPGELASEAMAAWSDGWAAAPDEAALKAAPRGASEGGGREIAEWIASAAEKGVLHEHGRLPETPAAVAAAEAEIPASADLSLLPEAAKAEAALAELRRAMKARLRK